MAAARTTGPRGAMGAMGRTSLGALVLGALAVIVFLRRQNIARGEHVDLYYADGSMLSLENGGSDSQRMLDVAREALRGLKRRESGAA
jgi:hypothetical protein